MAASLDEPLGHTVRHLPAAYHQGDVQWLQDTAFIPANCFQPPSSSKATQPRPWDRVAVPPSTSRHGEHKIYKRVGALIRFDRSYRDAVNELESQGFGPRKRARSQAHIPPYGDAGIEREVESRLSGEEELSKAREQIRSAMLAEDPVSEASQTRNKQPTFEPTQLSWVPRKRHNTRWPIAPANKESPLIAELQPFIKFELHPSQIDDPAFLEQLRAEQDRCELTRSITQNNLEVPEAPPLTRISEPEDLVQKMQPQKRSQRRRTLRPRLSLGTIPEAVDEPSMFQSLTPGPKSRRTSLAPSIRLNVVNIAADKLKSPKTTKVAESPLRDFSMALARAPTAAKSTTPNANPGLSEMSPTAHVLSGLDCIEEIRDNDSETIPKNASKHEAVVAIFDQPPAVTYEEPAHEVKRRISFNNARRSDRKSDVKILKTISNYAPATRIGQRRRHSDFTQLHGASWNSTRRHTLDVDVGRNLDIFGQTFQETLPLETPSRLTAKFDNTKAQEKPSDVLPATTDQDQAKDQVVTSTPNDGLSSSENVVEHEKGINGDSTAPSDMINNAQADEEDVVLETMAGSLLERVDLPEDATIEPQAEENDCQDDENHDVALLNHEVDSTVKAFPNETMNYEIASGEQEEEDEIDQMVAAEIQDKVEQAAVQEVGSIMDNIIMKQIGDREEEQGEDDIEGDSDMADLLSFVRRNKERKGGQTAMTLPPLRPKKRRSGSISSATSETGSPMAKTDATPAATARGTRVPLGAKDANKSPSPMKRKLKAAGSDVPLKKMSRLVAPDLEDHEPAKPKKRRRKMESDTDDVFNPDMGMGQDLTQRGVEGPRRSTRVASTKKANVSAPSSIPVRLGALADFDMPAPSTTGLTNAILQKKAAAELRSNTQKNKGGALPPAMVLAAMAESMEDEDTTTSCTTGSENAITRPCGGKTVRWDEVLARVQGEESDEAASDTQPAEEKTQSDEIEVEEEDIQLPSPPQLRIVADDHEEAKVQQPEPENNKQVATAAGSVPRRNTRSMASSRLPTRGGGVPCAVATPKKSGLPAPTKAARGGVVTGGARRRMSGPGTPAPRRAGRRVI